MDFLSKAFAQLRDLFASMTPGARITAALLLVVVVVSVAYLFVYEVSGPDAYLMGGEPFSPSDLSQMQAAFGKAGLGDHQIEGNRIRIPHGQHAAYMAALADADAVPQAFGSYMERALDKKGVLEDKHTREERMKVAVERELGRVIQKMHGIRDALVIVARLKAKGLATQDEVTASVSIEPMNAEELEPQRIRRIQKLVASSVPGLKPEKVAVVGLDNLPFASDGTGGIGDDTDDPYYELKASFERRLENDIRDHLKFVPGVQVQVSAQLDREMRYKEESVVFDPKLATPIQSRVRDQQTTNDQGAGGGRVGLAAQGAQGPAAPPVSIAATNTSKSGEKTHDEETQNAVPSRRISREMAGLTPTQVRASIVVPSSYYLQVWNERNRTADGSEPAAPEANQLKEIESSVQEDIRKGVTPLLPSLADGADPLSQVIVTTFQSLTPQPIPSPPLTENALAWLGESWRTLAMLALAVFCLMMLRSMMKSARAPEALAAAAPSTLAILPEEGSAVALEGEEESTTGLPKRRFVKGPSYKDELAAMVRDDPDTAATILRNWIANAS